MILKCLLKFFERNIIFVAKFLYALQCDFFQIGVSSLTVRMNLHINITIQESHFYRFINDFNPGAHHNRRIESFNVFRVQTDAAPTYLPPHRPWKIRSVNPDVFGR